MTAGENIANFSVVCIYIDGRAHLADADSSAYMPAIAMNTTGGTISSGAQGDFLIFGIVRNTAWAFTIGKPIYVDPATDGVISSTMPTTASECVQVVGYAISPDSFVFNPSPDFVVLKA